ncbi:uncharacterized protein LOC133914488 isoform X2 [Phragmites australis]|uniref:uncharacterized protein LOC133914488 isoform X2 n=1 Tax=Phragmites australis TaxID=29695 RepID=UPI002D791A04|nr:uncharacterized protein LOC133914488 isoform X2 [Phragmites australis]
MEFFPDGDYVRLRSSVRGMYLHADEDGAGVSLSPRRAARATLNAAWRVERIVRDGTTYVLLQGAAYGRYLAASFAPAPPGHLGQRVHARDHDVPEVDAIRWKAVRAEDGDEDDIVLRHVTNRLLRANGRYRPWYTGVTVDDYANLCTMMHWVVEAIPLRPPPLLLPPFLNQGGHGGLFWRRAEPVVEWRRIIRFVRADDLGNFNPLGWATFQFNGRSVFLLRSELGHRLNAAFIFTITVCVKPGFYGRLTPLLGNLPCSEEPMDIFVLNTGSQAAEELRYPDVDAP